MTNIKNTKNIEKIEAKGFQDLCNHIRDLEQENEFLEKQNKALKLRCSKYCLENRKLEQELTDLKFSRKFLGVPMTDEDLAIEAAENSYRPYNGDDF